MRIDLRGVGVGVRDDGAWVQRTPEGFWDVIPKPAWAEKYNSPGRAGATVTVMVDPQERAPEQVKMVHLRRVLRKTVPDYEADVLLRNGWEYDTD